MPGKGKNKGKCLTYKQHDRRNRNKRRKLEKHLKKHPNDVVGEEALSKL